VAEHAMIGDCTVITYASVGLKKIKTIDVGVFAHICV
jgi:hypothetical protein